MMYQLVHIHLFFRVRVLLFLDEHNTQDLRRWYIEKEMTNDEKKQTTKKER